MNLSQLARLALAAACCVTAIAGAELALQAHEFLADAFRVKAAWMVGLASAALLCAAGLVVTGRRGGLLLALASAAAMLLLVILGLAYMGNQSLYAAMLQASCAPGFAVCFNQSSTVMQLCILLLVVGGAAAYLRKP